LDKTNIYLGAVFSSSAVKKVEITSDPLWTPHENT